MSAHKIAKSLLLTAVLMTLPRVAAAQQMEAHMGKLTGHSDAGKQLYYRFCWGCHGFRGDGGGENWLPTGSYPTQPYLNIQPRNFDAAVFKCRSTATGTLPLDQDLYNSVGRGFVMTNMPAWISLTNQKRADLVAFIKRFSPRFRNEKPVDPFKVPPEPKFGIN